MLEIIAIAFALTNMLGGRFENVWGEKPPFSGRLFFRGIMPGVLLACAASETFNSLAVAAYVFFATLIGSLVWFCFEWSFEEQHGVADPTKYPSVVRKLAYRIWQEDGTYHTNRLRGIFLKGVRGMYDFLTFALLLPINKYALFFWPLTFSMGVIYWAVSKIVPGQRQDVLTAEAGYGFVRGWVLGFTVLTADLAIWHTIF